MKLISLAFCCFLLFIFSMKCIDTKNITDQTNSQLNFTNSQINKQKTYLTQNCVQNCQQNNNELPSSTNKIIFIILITLSIIIGLGIFIALLCTKKVMVKCMRKLNRKNKLIPIFRNKYDVLSSGIISEKLFQNYIRNLLSLFQNSIQNKGFGYKKQDDQQNNYCKIIVTFKKQNALHYKIEIQGEDSKGDWYGEGSILCQNQNVFIWFTQQFYDISKRWREDIRIFSSTNVSKDYVLGKWCIYKVEDQIENIAGSWVLTSSNDLGTSSQRLPETNEIKSIE